MKAATILALVGAANAHQLQWRGPAINFDLASSWSSGVPHPVAPPLHTHSLGCFLKRIVCVRCFVLELPATALV
jgi:hypothetical protein